MAKIKIPWQLVNPPWSGDIIFTSTHWFVYLHHKTTNCLYKPMGGGKQDLGYLIQQLQKIYSEMD